MTDDPFHTWRLALDSGKPVDVPKGTIACGYYRARDGECIAFLPGEDGLPSMWRSSDERVPKDMDKMVDIFSWVSMYPVSHENANAHYSTGLWPDQIAPVAIPADLPAHEAAARELAGQQEAAKAWFLTLKDENGKSRKPATKEEADKAGNFADKFQKIEKNAIDKHKDEKDPILKAGKEVDAKWFPTRDAAVTAKKWARSLSDEYVKAEQARRDEEARVANEKARVEFEEAKRRADEQATRDAELAAKGVMVPQFAPPIAAPRTIVAEPVRIGTSGRRQSLRTTDSYEISDATALLRFLAERNVKSDKLLAAALADASTLRAAGIEVPGLKLVVKEEVR